MSKNKRAVLISIVNENGKFRIKLDDVAYQEGSPPTWTQKEHYTSKLLPEGAFEELNFEEKELADFGYSILARLAAFRKCGEI
ncbi:MAG: hypothetical protein KDI90_05190 [Alphaproteobacteria bacterium]|nr:hypothetical protein [Alphaproteobacteria bacterium]